MEIETKCPYCKSDQGLYEAEIEVECVDCSKHFIA